MEEAAMKKTLLVLLLLATTLLACDDDGVNAPEVREWRGYVQAYRPLWYPATAPTTDATGPLRLADADRQPAMWYNIEPVIAPHLIDLYPNLEKDLAEFRPEGWPPYPRAEHVNRIVPALDIELFDPPSTGSWTGVMASPIFAAVYDPARPGATDFSESTALSLWVNDFKPDPADRGGSVHIDIGVLDEDFYQPERDEWNDEDPDGDGFQAAYDDTGLDGSFGGSDNFDPTRINGRFLRINGTEGNLRYDTEDLDRSGYLDAEGAFYRFTIPLADAAEIDVRRDYPDYDGWVREHSSDAWRMYVIDIADAVVYAPGGTMPDVSNVRHIRVWIEDLPAVFHTEDRPGKQRFQFAEFKFLM
jgi:hypothetical protein